jgi:hypothetical protein
MNYASARPSVYRLCKDIPVLNKALSHEDILCLIMHHAVRPMGEWEYKSTRS